jgi:hypothetical protein
VNPTSLVLGHPSGHVYSSLGVTDVKSDGEKLQNPFLFPFTAVVDLMCCNRAMSRFMVG